VFGEADQRNTEVIDLFFTGGREHGAAREDDGDQ
jgi:hypothetical protein